MKPHAFSFREPPTNCRYSFEQEEVIVDRYAGARRPVGKSAEGSQPRRAIVVAAVGALCRTGPSAA